MLLSGFSAHKTTEISVPNRIESNQIAPAISTFFEPLEPLFAPKTKISVVEDGSARFRVLAGRAKISRFFFITGIVRRDVLLHYIIQTNIRFTILVLARPGGKIVNIGSLVALRAADTHERVTSSANSTLDLINRVHHFVDACRKVTAS